MGEYIVGNAESEWLTPQEVANVLRVHPATLVRWAKEGRVPSVRTPGKHRRYRRDIIERILAGEDVSIPPEEVEN